MVDGVVNGGDQHGDAGRLALAQPLGGSVAEEVLNHGQPGGRSEGARHLNRRPLGQSLLYDRTLAGVVVVGDQVRRVVLRRLLIDLAQKLEPLRVAVSPLPHRHDPPVQHVERGGWRARSFSESMPVARDDGRVDAHFGGLRNRLYSASLLRPRPRVPWSEVKTTPPRDFSLLKLDVNLIGLKATETNQVSQCPMRKKTFLDDRVPIKGFVFHEALFDSSC